MIEREEGQPAASEPAAPLDLADPIPTVPEEIMSRAMDCLAVGRFILPPMPDHLAYLLGIDYSLADAVMAQLEAEGKIDMADGFRRWTDFATMEFAEIRDTERVPVPVKLRASPLPNQGTKP